MIFTHVTLKSFSTQVLVILLNKPTSCITRALRYSLCKTEQIFTGGTPKLIDCSKVRLQLQTGLSCFIPFSPWLPSEELCRASRQFEAQLRLSCNGDSLLPGEKCQRESERRSRWFAVASWATRQETGCFSYFVSLHSCFSLHHTRLPSVWHSWQCEKTLRSV